MNVKVRRIGIEMYAEQEFKSTLDRNSENYAGYELKSTLDWNKTITMDMNGNVRGTGIEKYAG